jgi:hypothetical protein
MNYYDNSSISEDKEFFYLSDAIDATPRLDKPLLSLRMSPLKLLTVQRLICSISRKP